MNIVAILANGVGARFGSNVPKQFHKVNGKILSLIECFNRC